MHISTNPGIWCQAICTLAVLTYLYKDNPIWRTVESIYLGLATAYWFVYYFWSFIKPAVMDWVLVQHQWHYILAIIMGLLIFFRYVPSLSWIARYPMSYWVGYGAGYVLAYQPAVWLQQITDSFRALNTLANVLIFIGILCTLAYFFFTLAKENPVVGGIAEVGKWYIMVALGSAFGNTVLYRWNLFLGRANMLIGQWLGFNI